MDKLISREDALKALDEMSYKSPHESATSVVRKKHFGEILEKFIMQQPSAQKKGHWIDEETNYLCSECHRGCWVNSDYCPWCGANMRGEQDG